MTAFDSDFKLFSLGRKHSYDSWYNWDSVSSENLPTSNANTKILENAMALNRGNIKVSV